MAINRVWHGWATPANADAYEWLRRNGMLPSFQEVPGLWGH